MTKAFFLLVSAVALLIPRPQLAASAAVAAAKDADSNTGGGDASRKRRRPKQLPKVEDVLEAIVQTVEAGTDHSGAVSVELYGQVLANVMSTIRDRRGNEDALIATTEDKARRAEKQSNKSLSSKSNEERFKSLYQDAQDQNFQTEATTT